MNLENLTRVQREKWDTFLQLYPQFVTTGDLFLTTARLGAALRCRPDNVPRLLQYISRGLGNTLRFQRMVRDSRHNLLKADHLDIRNMRGGRQRGSSKTKGIQGNSVWLHLWME